MTFDDQDLMMLAEHGTMDYPRWPQVLARAIPRLDHIIYNEFPIPSIPLSRPVAIGLKREEEVEGPPEKKIRLDDAVHDEPQSEEMHDSGIPKTPTEDVPNTDSIIKTSPVQTNLELPANTLPPTILTLVSTIRSTLQSTFPNSPPHTAQRLAELLLYPSRHYRTLPSYLRALDRIVSVASPASIFPLPNIQPSSTANGILLNGIGSAPSSPTLGGNPDFIGGAELTEIPWLRDSQAGVEGSNTNILGSHNGAASDLRTESTSLIDGPRGAGSVETVTVDINGGPGRSSLLSSGPSINSSVVAGTSVTAPDDDIENDPPSLTQGEILRQEQEAGIAPVPMQTGNRVTRSSTAASVAAAQSISTPFASSIAQLPSSSDDEPTETDKAETLPQAPLIEEEKVHARGPDTIGMEDMGPQAIGSGLEDGISKEGALGRKDEPDNAGGDDDEEHEQEKVKAQTILHQLDGVGEEEEEGDEKAGLARDQVEEEGGKQETNEVEHRETEEEEDFVLVDADGMAEGDLGRRNEMSADAVDTTVL